MRSVPLLALGALVVATCVGCAPSSPAVKTHQPAAASAVKVPATYAVLGVDKTVTDASGASATVRLNAVKYAPIDGLTELAIVDLTYTGATAKPFSFTEDDVDFEYGTKTELFHHEFGDTHLYGPLPIEDYTSYGAPLRIGAVTAGQTKRGLVILRMSPDSDYILDVSDDSTADPLAQWALHSQKA